MAESTEGEDAQSTGGSLQDGRSTFSAEEEGASWPEIATPTVETDEALSTLGTSQPAPPPAVVLGPRSDGTALSHPSDSAPEATPDPAARPRTTTLALRPNSQPTAQTTRVTNTRAISADGDQQTFAAPTTSTDSARVRGSRTAPLLGLVGLLAIGLAGLFAYRMTVSQEADRTAEEAVADFLEALNRQDTIGAAESLVPDERDPLITHAPDVLEQLQRLDVFGDINLNSLQGTEVSVDGDELEFVTEELSDDVHRVVITGPGISFTGRGSQVPTGQLLNGSITGSTTNAALAEDVFSGGIQLMTLRKDNRFSVSRTYTFAEVLRNYNQWPEPTFDRVVEPVGGANPEDAVRQALRAVEAGDLEALVSMADPEAGGVFYDYAPAWWTHSPQVKDFADEASFDIAEMSFEVTGSGQQRSVRLASFDYTGTDLQNDPFNREPPVVRNTFDGECYRIEGDPGFAPNRTGPIEERRERWMTEGVCRSDLENSRGVETLLAPLGGRGPNADRVVVVERDGRWFVHPTESVLEHWLRYARTLRPSSNDFWEGQGHWTAITELLIRPLAVPLPNSEAINFANDNFLLSQLDGGN